MKLAILGTDDDVLRLAAAARSDGHEIVWIGDVRPADADGLSELAPQLADRGSEWELLLDEAIADAVVVGRGAAPDELRAEQFKRLAAEAVPLLVVHPAGDSVLLYYELDMTRRQTGGVLQHYNPLADHPIVPHVAQWVLEGHPTVGPIHQVACQRRVADGSRASVLAHLARDLELLVATAGDIRRVSAIGPASHEASFASLQVQMTTGGPVSLRWSVGSSAGAGSGLEMTLLGEQGTVTLRVPETATADGQAEWQLETTSNGEHERQLLAAHDAPLAAIHALHAAVIDLDVERRSEMSSWPTATRAMEVVDAVELSLEKGRTIEVHQQRLTEQVAFRGTMAAIGCGLLLVGFAVVVFVAILGGAEEAVGQRLVPAWPVVLLAVLAFFLLLQALPLLVRRSSKGKGPAPPSHAAR